MIRVGLLGLGGIASMHREAIRACKDLRLVAGYTRNPDRLAALSREWGFSPHGTIQGLLDDPQVDAVVVLTPSADHFEHVSAALQAGKHVLVEKPVALTGKEVMELARMGLTRGLVCMPAHCLVYRPVLQRARALLAEGAVGTPYFSQIALVMPISAESMQGWRGQNARSGGGALVDSGTHRLYQMIYLMGRATQVFAYTGRHKQPIEGEDLALLSLRFASGALGVVLQSWVSRDPTFPEMKVLGAKGTVWLSDYLYLNERPLLAQASRQDAFDRMLQQFADCIGAGATPLSTMEDAEMTARTIEAAYESVTTGAAVTIPASE
jgi:UDP-N-acetylglucosamine 3-dehydrogenase